MARTTVVGACPHDCPDTCSILTTVEDGKAIAVRGNPDHPFTRGRLCVKVNNYEERVYSDKRVLHPLKRVGPEGLEAVPADFLGRGDRHHCQPLEVDHRRTWRAGDPALQLSRHPGHHQRAQRRRPAVQQARRHRGGAHLLRLRLLHRLHDDDRPHARGRSRKLRALEVHSSCGPAIRSAPTRITGRSSSRPGKPAPSWW